ncbi:hypothetical protein DNTS_005352 [Danionella cerebrum]|uniref:MAM domain-containing protein n=1 Tax=Danionella cerebrum TaxID=2873325 RepID=A0A553MQY2_9TELE|nr:hypothetical protein DNTS_005352 [Danionella translucida]
MPKSALPPSSGAENSSKPTEWKPRRARQEAKEDERKPRMQSLKMGYRKKSVEIFIWVTVPVLTPFSGEQTGFCMWSSYLLVNASQYSAGQRAQLMLHPLSENDTHCVQFSFFLYSRDGHSPGALNVYVRVNGGTRGNAVWNVSGSQGREWHQVELAISTFWPSEYQLCMEQAEAQVSGTG